MGVPGLTSFVDDNPELLTDLHLHDTKVIIDGNNLYHFLYYYLHISHQFGGDYDHFADSVRYFLDTLRTCGVEPYIVFDGSYDPGDSKLPTVLRRARERINLAHFLSRGGRGKILPILAYECFRNVLKETGIPHVVCDCEADEQIAALATRWRCPVMSNDSDFYVFDLPGGFILLDYMNLQILTSTDMDPPHKYIAVQIYFLDNLLGQFTTLKRPMIPVFATILGNDIVDGRLFENFFVSGVLPKSSNNHIFKKKQAKMTRLLTWLENISTPEEAVNIAMSYVESDKQRHAMASVEKSLESYRNPQTNLEEFFLQKTSDCVCVATEWRTYRGEEFPDWLVSGIRVGEVPVLVANAMTLHRVILPTQVEIMTLPSTHQCAVPIRKVLYAILLADDNKIGDECNTEAASSQQDLMVEYDRDQKNLKKKCIELVSELVDGLPIPGLSEIAVMSEPSRQHLLVQILGRQLPELAFCSEGSKLLFAVILYWAEHAQPKVTQQHLLTVLLCHIKLAVLDMPEEKTQPEVLHQMERNSKNECSMSDNGIYDAANQKLKKYKEPPKCTHSRPFDGSIIHAFSQFQASLHAAMHLNMLLRSPLYCPPPQLIFNGTFVYNFYRDLQNRPDPKLFICELLGRKSAIASHFELMFDNLILLLTESALLATHLSEKKHKKKVKRKKEKSKTVDVHNEKETDVKKVKVKAACELSNKFDLLTLGEDNIT